MSTNPYADAVVHLDPAQLDTVLDALEDAADYRWSCMQVICDHCARLDPAQCDDHARDEEAWARYVSQARQLKQETGR